MIEYALLVSLIGVVAFAGVSMVGHRTEDKFEVIAQGLDGQVVTAIDHLGEDLAEDEVDTPPEEEASDPEPDPGAGGSSGGAGDDSAGGSPGDAGGSGEPGGPVDTEPTVEVTLDGSDTAITSASSAIIDWQKSKKGGKGEWAATFDFANDWKANQVLSVEVTYTDELGKTKTEHVKVSVPAIGSGSLTIDGNSLTAKDGELSGVLAVTIKVVSIATTDDKGNPVTYNLSSGQTATATAPPTP